MSTPPSLLGPAETSNQHGEAVATSSAAFKGSPASQLGSTSQGLSETEPLRKPRPFRKRRRLPGGTTDKPKSILKPSPPPQKPFSFRRDILQNLNTRLAQQGVNVQVPLPQAGSAQGAANLLGGVFRRIGGMAAGAAGAALGSTLPEQQPHQSPRNQNPSPQTQGQQSDSPSPAAASLQNVAARLQAVSNNSVSSSSLATPPGGPAAENQSPNPSLASTSALPAPSSSVTPLKRVQFTVSKMAVVYPISSEIPIEDEDDTRQRIEKLHRQAMKDRKERNWTPQELEALYRECCRVREEHPLKKMRLVFEDAAKATPPSLRTLDLSFLPLDRQAIDPLADLLSVDFGLSRLVLENCGLTDDGLKAILHALLISGTLPNLSLASNRKIKYHGWRYVAIFMRRARALRYLDLSENSINRASLEHIIEAIRKPQEVIMKERAAARASAPDETDTKSMRMVEDDEAFDEDGEPLMPPAPFLRQVTEEGTAPLTTAVISLRMENCGVKGASLAQLAQAIRFSDIKHVSLRRNRINQMGAVALAIMLKDYPDAVMTENSDDPGLDASEGHEQNGDSSVTRSGRSRTRSAEGYAVTRDWSPALPEIPLITSSPAGGMTARKAPPGAKTSLDTSNTDHLPEEAAHGQAKASDSTAFALTQAKRAKKILDNMPRMGNLLTLDLKSNDIRSGVTYLAQTLRKNRTLRVLNLSDNGIDMQGLVAIAEALRYNSTLETLDVSHNPCAGPGLEGITTLRMAFALNSNLKRLFMNDTDFSSEGAIALAEFLPEARSLIHLDLTENFEIDIAGVMALAVSVKMNKSLRCLDLNIPPNDPDFARLSQDILQSCIRNTQLAQRKAQQKGLKQPVAAPIYKSVVARAAQEKDERAKAIEKAREAEQSAAAAAAANRAQSQEKLIDAAEQCYVVLRDLLAGEQQRLRDAQSQDQASALATNVPGEFIEELVGQSRGLRQRLAKLIAGMSDETDTLAKALKVNDELAGVTERLVIFYRETSKQANHADSVGQTSARKTTAATGTGAGSIIPAADPNMVSSPSFSVGSDEEDDEEVDGGSKALSRAAEGLRIEVDAGRRASEKEPDQAVAAEREGSVGDDISPRSPRSESKARSMIDEEGEIFKRARSLQLTGEDEEDQHEQSSGETVQSSSKYDDATADSSAPTVPPRPVSSTSSESLPSPPADAPAELVPGPVNAAQTADSLPDISGTEEHDTHTAAAAAAAAAPSSSDADVLGSADVSGEELRRQLLEVQQ